MNKVIKVPENKTEGTAYPWWFIVLPNQMNRFCKKEDMVANIAMSIIGPFFSRETAEAHRKSRIYEYGQSSKVWCGSAYYSQDYRNIYEEVENESI